MIIEQTSFYIIILIAIALIILLIGVVLAYLRMVGKYLDLKEVGTEGVDPQTIIRQAQEKAQRILENAQYDARETISKAGNFLDINQNLVAKELQRASQIYAKKYEQILLVTQDNIIKTIQTIPEDSKKVLLSEISAIRTLLSGQVQKAADEAKNLVTDAYKKAEMEVENYKNVRMREIDESIVMILKEVARKVLAKEISQEEHEKLAELIPPLKLSKIILMGPRVSKYTYPRLKGLIGNSTSIEKFTLPKEALDYILTNIKGGEVILFKGARFLEGVIEHLLADKADVEKLCRRERVWQIRRRKWEL